MKRAEAKGDAKAIQDTKDYIKLGERHKAASDQNAKTAEDLAKSNPYGATLKAMKFDPVLLAREVFMGVIVLVAKRHGWLGLPVHFAGKAATFNLLYAFPLLLLAEGDGTVARVAEPIAWAFVWWGVSLYWLSGVLYAVQLRRLLALDRAVAA